MLAQYAWNVFCRSVPISQLVVRNVLRTTSAFTYRKTPAINSKYIFH